MTSRIRKSIVNRRSFLAQVAGSGLAVGALAMVSGRAWGQSAPCSDTDIGPTGDPANRGRNCAARVPIRDQDSGASSDAPSSPPRRPPGRRCTDADTGAGADPANGGRNCRPQPPLNDADTGPNADPVMRPPPTRCGREGRGCLRSDQDSGPGADPAGQPRRRVRTGLTDRDTGSERDPAQYGRGATRRP